MAITSYATLKDELTTWFGGDTRILDTAIDNAEMRIRYGSEDALFPSPALRTRDMIETTDIALNASGIGTLPDDFLAPYKVTAETDPRRELEYVSANWQEEAYPTTDSGYPKFYTIIGESIKVRPTTDSDIELVYYQDFDSLGDSQATNWIITAAPGVYLYGGMLERALFLRQLPDAQMFYRAFNGAISGLMKTEKQSRATIPARRAHTIVA